MKKGAQTQQKAFLVQVKDIHNKTVGGGLCRSLRQAVVMATELVSDMDNYSKVYREFTLMKGAYAGVFFAKYKDSPAHLAAVGRKPSKHLFVLINAALLPSIELQFDGASDGPTEGGFLGGLEELMTE
ncbi:MAG: hypothetical protein EOO60_02590 [Hymenobacter sp.]|nr:MAG: hypothetical protein EOO60_02590 [Hymenobacter sp.]